MKDINYQKRILSELEKMLADQILDCLEVDESAKQVFDKFIKPIVEYSELLEEKLKIKNT